MKKGNIFGILVLSLIIITGFFYEVNGDYIKNQEDIVEGLSNSLIRFHVIANSDSEEDQALKIKVKNAVIERMSAILKNSTSKEESKEIIIENMDELKTIAENIILNEGRNDTITIALEDEEFPLKTYGDVVLPSGTYEALIIRIGEGNGKNWWCVLFPPLCFVDGTHGLIDAESKEDLKAVLTEEEYNAIVMTKNEDVDIKVKVKLFEWIEETQEEMDFKMFAEIFGQKD